jgi:hypothetical protein
VVFCGTFFVLVSACWPFSFVTKDDRARLRPYAATRPFFASHTHLVLPYVLVSALLTARTGLVLNTNTARGILFHFVNSHLCLPNMLAHHNPINRRVDTNARSLCSRLTFAPYQSYHFQHSGVKFYEFFTCAERRWYRQRGATRGPPINCDRFAKSLHSCLHAHKTLYRKRVADSGEEAADKVLEAWLAMKLRKPAKKSK